MSGSARSPASTRQLGCPTDYEVIVTARDLTAAVGSLRWSSISWSRALDDISDAEVVVPDAFSGLNCGIEFSGLVPWRYGLRIERDGEVVWAGPIVNISRQAGEDAVSIRAMDKMAWLMRRTASADLVFTDADAGTVFRSVIDDAVFSDNAFNLFCPTFTTGYVMSRDIVALDFEYSADVVNELARAAVDYVVIGQNLYVFDQGEKTWKTTSDGVDSIPFTDQASASGQLILGLFTEESWVERPGYDLDGMSQANNIYVPGADSGEAGFRRFWTASDVDILDGILTFVDTNPLYRPREGTPITAESVFQRRADSLLSLRRNTPVIINGGSLHQHAPCPMSLMLPGSLWSIDLADHGIASLVTVQRLKSVSVSVLRDHSGPLESVSPTLIPLGADESQGGV